MVGFKESVSGKGQRDKVWNLVFWLFKRDFVRAEKEPKKRVCFIVKGRLVG